MSSSLSGIDGVSGLSGIDGVSGRGATGSRMSSAGAGMRGLLLPIHKKRPWAERSFRSAHGRRACDSCRTQVIPAPELGRLRLGPSAAKRGRMAHTLAISYVLLATVTTHLLDTALPFLLQSYGQTWLAVKCCTDANGLRMLLARTRQLTRMGYCRVGMSAGILGIDTPGAGCYHPTRRAAAL